MDQQEQVSPDPVPPAAPARRSLRNRLFLRKPAGRALLAPAAVLALLLLITALAYQARIPAAQYADLPDIDTYYFLRLSEYVLLHNGQLPDVDTFRNWPHGDMQFDYPLPIFLPAFLYPLVNSVFPITYFRYVFFYPVLLGAIAVFVVYFLGRWLFQDRLAGLFAAFFAATIPAYITRTSAGIIEKEATTAPFMFASLALFALAFRTKRWIHGLAAAVCYTIFAAGWGGVSFFALLLSFFALVLMLFNRDHDRLLVALVPSLLASLAIQIIAVPFAVSLLSPTTTVPLVVSVLIIVLAAIKRFSLLPPQQFRLVVPTLLVLGLFGLAVGQVVSDDVARLTANVVNLLTFEGTAATTVAESIGGDWAALASQAGVEGVAGAFPFLDRLAPVFSVWLLAIAGYALLFWRLNTKKQIAVPALLLGLLGLGLITIQSSAAVRPEQVIAGVALAGAGILLSLYRNQDGDRLMLLPILWMVLGVIGVYFGIRLIYLAGPALALLAGAFLAFGVRRVARLRLLKNASWATIAFAGAGLLLVVGAVVWWQPFPIPAQALLASGALLFFLAAYNRFAASPPSGPLAKLQAFLAGQQPRTPAGIILIPLALYLAFLVATNATLGVAYGQALGPSVNQPFNEAMAFLREQTPPNSSVISWWDFGYWFQTTGRRPTIADGGGAGNVSRYDLALWFTAPAENWTGQEAFLKEKLHVDYILMDFTLPGKYGAITKIATNAQAISGFLQFGVQPTNTFEQDNRTIVEFSSGPYAIWVPTVGNRIVDRPLLLISQNGQVVSSAPINDLCTGEGISILSTEPGAGGCLSLSSLGIFYLPPETEHTIFSRLMFMDGAGLPIQKVFDNQAIKIYHVPYGNETTHAEPLLSLPAAAQPPAETAAGQA